MAPKLGWLHICLAASDMEASCTFWETVGFRQVDGQCSEGWAIMHNAATEIGLYKGHIEDGSLTLNFRGADTNEWREYFRNLGMNFFDEGSSKPDGSGSFTVLDPAGNKVFFDSAPEERVRFEAGKRLGVGDGDGSLQEGLPLLGVLDVCFFVDDVADCQTFYQHLGLRRVGGEMKHNWVSLTNGWHHIALYGRQHQDEYPDFLVNLRGGDVQAIADRLKAAGLELDVDANLEDDGSMGCVLSDPDGWCIYFNTDPSERLY
jgi:catechol 2,3-dioxygenase-like lactoylglutathione lyase family enzyme